MLLYDKVADLETYRAEYGSYTAVRFVNQHGAITWAYLFDGYVKPLPKWFNLQKLEADYQKQLSA